MKRIIAIFILCVSSLLLYNWLSDNVIVMSREEAPALTESAAKILKHNRCALINEDDKASREEITAFRKGIKRKAIQGGEFAGWVVVVYNFYEGETIDVIVAESTSERATWKAKRAVSSWSTPDKRHRINCASKITFRINTTTYIPRWKYLYLKAKHS